MKKALGILLRILGIFLAVGLLCWVVSGTGANISDALTTADKRYLLLGLLAVGSTHALGAFRWKLLLEVQDVHCTWWLLTRLTLVGDFFSHLIPGAVSGDIIKLAYIVRHNPGRSAQAVLSGIMDRIVGVSGLFWIGALAGGVFALCNPDKLAENRLLGLAILIVLGVAIAALCALVMLLCVKSLPGCCTFLPNFIRDFLARLIEAAAKYRGHKKILLYTLLISMLIHSILGIGLFFVGRALGENECGFANYFLSAQLGNAVTIASVTPGGIGLRDTVIASFFQTDGQLAAQIIGSIPIVNSMLIVFWSLIGGIVLFCLPRKNNTSPEASE